METPIGFIIIMGGVLVSAAVFGLYKLIRHFFKKDFEKYKKYLDCAVEVVYSYEETGSYSILSKKVSAIGYVVHLDKTHLILLPRNREDIAYMSNFEDVMKGLKLRYQGIFYIKELPGEKNYYEYKGVTNRNISPDSMLSEISQYKEAAK